MRRLSGGQSCRSGDTGGFGGVFFPAVADLPGTSGPDFVAQAYDADPQLGRCFDALAYHPYAYPFTAPELDVPVGGSVIAAAAAIRSVLRAHDDAAKQVWITEVGWPTHDRTYGVPEIKQALRGGDAGRLGRAETSRADLDTYGDFPDPTGGADQEAWFGFFRLDVLGQAGRRRSVDVHHRARRRALQCRPVTQARAAARRTADGRSRLRAALQAAGRDDHRAVACERVGG